MKTRWTITVCTECGARTEHDRDYDGPLPVDDCGTDRGCGRFAHLSSTGGHTLVYCLGEKDVDVVEMKP